MKKTNSTLKVENGVVTIPEILYKSFTKNTIEKVIITTAFDDLLTINARKLTDNEELQKEYIIEARKIMLDAAKDKVQTALNELVQEQQIKDNTKIKD